MRESVGDYFVQNLARGLMGDQIKSNQMKWILFDLVKMNTGKDVLSNALQLACDGYVDSFSPENVTYRNISNDEAQMLRWAMLLQYKRIIISNKLKSTTEPNGNITWFEKVASGGDILIARGHCQNETEFITHFLPVVLTNDIPNIKPYDDAVDNWLHLISYIQ